MRRISGLAVGIFALGVSASSCKKNADTDPSPDGVAGSAQASVSSSPLRKPERPPHNWPLPSGPVLAILANQGVGPIRIGATVATIERLMALRCEVKDATVCRYPSRGVEFNLENGVTKTVHVHRAGRPAGKDREFGFYHGGIPPDLQLGMVPNAIQEHLGPPKRIEKSGAAGTADKVEIHVYDGMHVEYDRIPNGNLVMGGVLIFREPKPDGGATPSPSAR
jgi:hypothetical protein